MKMLFHSLEGCSSAKTTYGCMTKWLRFTSIIFWRITTKLNLTDGWKGALKGDDTGDELSKFCWSVMCWITQRLSFVVKTGMDGDEEMQTDG
jgi:hypothetical protein